MKQRKINIFKSVHPHARSKRNKMSSWQNRSKAVTEASPSLHPFTGPWSCSKLHLLWCKKKENVMQFQIRITFKEVQGTFSFNGWEEQGRIYSSGVTAGWMQPKQLFSSETCKTHFHSKSQNYFSHKTPGTKSVPGNSFKLHVLYFPIRCKLTSLLHPIMETICWQPHRPAWLSQADRLPPAWHSPPPATMPHVITSSPGPAKVISFEGLKLSWTQCSWSGLGSCYTNSFKKQQLCWWGGVDAPSVPGAHYSCCLADATIPAAISGAIQELGSNLASALIKTVEYSCWNHMMPVSR